MFNFDDIEQSKSKWQNGKPFNHLVIDNFMPEDVAEEVARQFPQADSDFWYEYSNPLKKLVQIGTNFLQPFTKFLLNYFPKK